MDRAGRRAPWTELKPSEDATPAVTSERTRPVEISPIEPQPAAQFPYRILVVDDEPLICETAKALLESQGYEVVTAKDGLDGLHALSKSLPDVIISDLHMPRMSGFEFLAIVRKRFPHIAIIAMSGEFIPGEELNVVMADAFWQKGQPTRNLYQEIVRVVAASPARSEREKNDLEPLRVQRSRAGYLILTCPKCLRPNKLEAISLNGGIHETICKSCGTPVKFEINQEIERTA
jgi:CheY-like chemotaxis protein